MTHVIGRLHVLTDTTLQSRWSHDELARMAAQAGADVVQLRDKLRRGQAELVDEAQAVAAALVAEDVQLIVNDDVEAARTIGADGVHLGREDAPVAEARARLGGRAFIGATANSLEEARGLFGESVDYLGVGPVFGTTSKAHPAPPLGLDALARIAQESPVPVIAIGGIRPEDVEAVLQSGAYGIAVLSGVVCQEDPRAAVRRYRQAIEAVLGKWRGRRTMNVEGEET